MPSSITVLYRVESHQTFSVMDHAMNQAKGLCEQTCRLNPFSFLILTCEYHDENKFETFKRRRSVIYIYTCS